jgi:hypothetical protein
MPPRENFGIDRIIHPEWYYNKSDDKYIEDTLRFATRLVDDGYAVKFIHGPVGLYESIILTVVSMALVADEDPLVTFKQVNNKDFIYFLFQYKADEGRLRYSRLSNKDFEMVQEKFKLNDKEKTP